MGKVWVRVPGCRIESFRVPAESLLGGTTMTMMEIAAAAVGPAASGLAVEKGRCRRRLVL
jgi:hypothetical protein